MNIKKIISELDNLNNIPGKIQITFTGLVSGISVSVMSGNIGTETIIMAEQIQKMTNEQLEEKVNALFEHNINKMDNLNKQINS